jgi:hypothetical protein
MPFRLIHRTNHQGLYIHAGRIADIELPYHEVIWTQAVWNGCDGCCPSFGQRIVGVNNYAFTSVISPDADQSNWCLYFVSETDRNHTFLKFLVASCNLEDVHPQEQMDGLRYIGNLRDASLLEDLEQYLDEFHRRSPSFVHFHIGLEMPILQTGFDTQQAEDEYYEEIELQIEVDRAIEEHIEQQAEDEYYAEIELQIEVDRAIDATAHVVDDTDTDTDPLKGGLGHLNDGNEAGAGIRGGTLEKNLSNRINDMFSIWSDNNSQSHAIIIQILKTMSIRMGAAGALEEEIRQLENTTGTPSNVKQSQFSAALHKHDASNKSDDNTSFDETQCSSDYIDDLLAPEGEGEASDPSIGT